MPTKCDRREAIRIEANHDCVLDKLTNKNDKKCCGQID